MIQGGRKGCRTNISHMPNLHIFTAKKLILAPINLEHLHVWDHNNILPMHLLDRQSVILLKTTFCIQG